MQHKHSMQLMKQYGSPKAGSEHGGCTLDVETKAAILVLVVAQVPEHFMLVAGCEGSIENSCHIAPNNHPWHQKHRAPVVAREVPVIHLEHGVEVNARLHVGQHPFGLGDFPVPWRCRWPYNLHISLDCQPCLPVLRWLASWTLHAHMPHTFDLSIFCKRSSSSLL